MTRRPCTECPWRVDVPPGQFPAERYDDLRATTGERGKEAPLGAPMFACHKSPDGREFVCAGWQAAVGYESLTARVAALQGVVDPRGFEPGEDWPELHDSYAALWAVHGYEAEGSTSSAPPTTVCETEDARGGRPAVDTDGSTTTSDSTSVPGSPAAGPGPKPGGQA